MKKISVLLVVHNEEKQISECLEKLYFSDEIVVILDKCTDNTLDYIHITLFHRRNSNEDTELKL